MARLKVMLSAFAACMAVHVAAVAWVAPEAASNTGRLRLGWNDAQPGRAEMLVLAMAVVVALTARGVFRLGAMVVTGAALAQLATFLTWGEAPDYLLVDGFLWNASDVLLLAGFGVCAVGAAMRLREMAS